jgi:ABC-type glycerol-3-phosphate transport system permease component
MVHAPVRPESPKLATIPLVLLFLVATRQIIAGLVAGMGK